MRKGTKMLRIASFLQIIFGVVYFFLARFLLGEGEIILGDLSGEDALMTVLISYGGCAFQVLAGLIGLALANKRAFSPSCWAYCSSSPCSPISSKLRVTLSQ